MNKSQQVVSVISALTQDPIDELGALMAEVSPKLKRIEKLKEKLKSRGAGVHEGVIFNATVSNQPGRDGWDTEALERLLHPNTLAACRKAGNPSLRIDVKAKQ